MTGLTLTSPIDIPIFYVGTLKYQHLAILVAVVIADIQEIVTSHCLPIDITCPRVNEIHNTRSNMCMLAR